MGASVIGDMSSRPNWGLNELDFVFSTAVVSSSTGAQLHWLQYTCSTSRSDSYALVPPTHAPQLVQADQHKTAGTGAVSSPC